MVVDEPVFVFLRKDPLRSSHVKCFQCDVGKKVDMSTRTDLNLALVVMKILTVFITPKANVAHSCYEYVPHWLWISPPLSLHNTTRKS